MPAQLFWNIGSFKFLVPSHFHIWWLKLQWPIVHKQNHNYVFWNHIHITNDQLFWNIKSTFTWVLSVDSWASHITLPMHWLRKPCERSFRKVKSTGSMFSDLLASFLLLASPVNIPIGAPWGQKFICFENYAAEPFFQQTGPLLLSQVWGCKWKPAVSFDSLYVVFKCKLSLKRLGSFCRPYSVDDPLFLWKRNHILPLAWNETLWL